MVKEKGDVDEEEKRNENAWWRKRETVYEGKVWERMTRKKKKLIDERERLEKERECE